MDARMKRGFVATALLACVVATAAAQVTDLNLLKPDPQDWLMCWALRQHLQLYFSDGESPWLEPLPRRSGGWVGSDRPADVKTVQELLNQVPATSGGPRPLLEPDGRSGPKTIAAIQAFQLHHFGWSGADGRVDPAGPTLAKLNEFDGSAPPVTRRVATLSMRRVGQTGNFVDPNRPAEWFYQVSDPARTGVSAVYHFGRGEQQDATHSDSLPRRRANISDEPLGACPGVAIGIPFDRIRVPRSRRRPGEVRALEIHIAVSAGFGSDRPSSDCCQRSPSAAAG